MHGCPGFLFGLSAMTQPKTLKCPRCRKDAAWEGNPDRPFCSERCRLIDLAAWADGEYRVPGEKPSPDEGPEEKP